MYYINNLLDESSHTYVIAAVAKVVHFLEEVLHIVVECLLST